MESAIKANATMVIDELGPISGIAFGFNSESVAWLEGYIERLRESGELGSEDIRHSLQSVFGSFLGECIIHCYGGMWFHDDRGWCVVFDSENAVHPFSKVTKQIESGLSEGISAFFRMIPALFGTAVNKPTDMPP